MKQKHVREIKEFLQRQGIEVLSLEQTKKCYTIEFNDFRGEKVKDQITSRMSSRDLKLKKRQLITLAVYGRPKKAS